ncbi:hypothetical protein JT358_13490 [Micrococcales bacterium 31B]|nr:hypothetical protein [Micrococcales bacterium 31B]
MQPEQNYYEVLNLDLSADETTIRAAIRKTRSRYRQLTGSPNKQQARRAEEMIEVLAAAENTLLKPDQRADYDAQLRGGTGSQVAQRTPPAPAPIARQDIRRHQPPTQPPAQPDPQARDHWLAAARQYFATGEYENALQAASHAATADRECAEAWDLQARALLYGNRPREAEFAASEANRLRPDVPATLGLLGDVYAATGRHGEAEKVYTEVVRLEPDSLQWQDRLMWALASSGKREQSIQLGTELVTRNPQAMTLRDSLAMQLLADADACLSFRPNDTNRFFTNRKQLQYYANRLEQVRALGPLGTDATLRRSESEHHLENAKRIRFGPVKGRTWGFTAMYVFVVATPLHGLLQNMLTDVGGTIAWVGVSGVLAGRFAATAWRRQWKVNREALGPHGKTGLQ